MKEYKKRSREKFPLKLESLESPFFENSKWLRTEETAEYLRTSPAQVRNWVYQGRLKAYRLMGRSLRFRKADLDLLFEGENKWL
jgi:excisionase family DNA binding protein